VGHFLLHILHDLSNLESTPVMLPHSAPMMQPLHPRPAPWSHDLGRPWLPLTQVLHAHLAASSASSCFVSCWVTRMPWTVLRPSFRSCQVEPLTCTSCCALPNSHLRAGCQYLRCRIPRQPHFSSAYTPDEFSCMAFHHQAHVCQQSALPIFLWRTYSRINLHCRFISLWAWLPAPLDIVLDSLSKCVPRARLTLLQRYTLMNFPKWKRLEHEQIEHLYALPVNWKQSLWCNVIWYILRKWTWMSYC